MQEGRGNVQSISPCSIRSNAVNGTDSPLRVFRIFFLVLTVVYNRNHRCRMGNAGCLCDIAKDIVDGNLVIAPIAGFIDAPAEARTVGTQYLSSGRILDESDPRVIPYYSPLPTQIPGDIELPMFVGP